MADLSQKVAALGPDSAALVRAAALLLIVVFGVKAALLPLYFWLPDTYRAASAPVAALFAIMTKVGIYCVARVTTLIFGAEAGVASSVAAPWLPWLAIGTLCLAALGTLAAVQLRTLVAYLVIASAGTLLLAIGLGSASTISAALFYLINSTFMAAALFLLVDSIASGRGEAGDRMVPAPLAHRGAYAALFFLFALEAAGLAINGSYPFETSLEDWQRIGDADASFAVDRSLFPRLLARLEELGHQRLDSELAGRRQHAH